MLNLLRRSLAPLFSIALLMLGAGYFTTFVSVRMEMEKFGSLLIGVVQAAYYAGFFIGAIGIEKFISKMRHIQAYAFFGSLCTCAILLQGLFLSPYAWIVVRFVMGFSMASLWVVIESWLLIISPKTQRGRILAFYLIALQGSQSLSQFFLDFVDTMSMGPFVITALLGTLSILPVTSTKGYVPDLEQASVENIYKIFKASPLGVTGCLFSGCMAGAVYSFLPIYALDTNLLVSLVVSIFILGGLILQWPIGLLSDYFSRGKVLIFICLMTLVFSIPIMFVTSKFWYVLGLCFLIGGFSFTIYPVCLAQVCDRYSTESITSLTSKMFFAFGLGAVIGPLIVPAFLGFFYPYGLFVFLIAISGMLVLIGFVSHFMKKPIAKEDQESYIVLPRVTPVVYELDPRSQKKEES